MNLGPMGLNQTQNEVFLHSLDFGSLVFLEIAYNDNLQQCLAFSKGKTHEKILGPKFGPNLIYKTKNMSTWQGFPQAKSTCMGGSCAYPYRIFKVFYFGGGGRGLESEHQRSMGLGLKKTESIFLILQAQYVGRNNLPGS